MWSSGYRGERYPNAMMLRLKSTLEMAVSLFIDAGLSATGCDSDANSLRPRQCPEQCRLIVVHVHRERCVARRRPRQDVGRLVQAVQVLPIPPAMRGIGFGESNFRELKPCALLHSVRCILRSRVVALAFALALRKGVRVWVEKQIRNGRRSR